MRDLWAELSSALANEASRTALEVALIMVGAFFGAKLLARLPPVRRLHPQHQLVLRRVVGVIIVVISVIWVLDTLGVGVGVLIGTAGILTVAFGFAAQTSMSNLISGFFLMAEQPFRVGDVICIGASTGEVISIELLSVRLRTFDNLMIRLANEDVLKSPVTNFTHFPLRRIDTNVKVPYDSDINAIALALDKIADMVPEALIEPPPLLLVTGVDEAGLQLQASIWTTSGAFARVRNQVYASFMVELQAIGIEPAAPQQRLEVTGEIPVVVRSA